jgi:hypothetical protein
MPPPATAPPPPPAAAKRPQRTLRESRRETPASLHRESHRYRTPAARTAGTHLGPCCPRLRSRRRSRPTRSCRNSGGQPHRRRHAPSPPGSRSKPPAATLALPAHRSHPRPCPCRESNARRRCSAPPSPTDTHTPIGVAFATA